MKELADNLRKAGLKVTPQRMAVYIYLDGTNEHPSAEIIYNALKPQYPSLSLATVYKTLSSLSKAGLIKEFDVCEGSHRYDRDTSFHTHLICTKCHKIFDCELNIPTQKYYKEISKKSGFTAESQDINFYGCCKECSENTDQARGD